MSLLAKRISAYPKTQFWHRSAFGMSKLCLRSVIPAIGNDPVHLLYKNL